MGWDNVKGADFFWNHQNGNFDRSEREYIINPALYKLMDDLDKCKGRDYQQ